MFWRLILFFLFFNTGFVSAGFLPMTEDIPLMDGIVLKETGYFSFDTPAGQILTFEGETKEEKQVVRDFYDKTLTALGWYQKKTDFYVRGNDTMTLSFPKKNKVRFDVLFSND